MDFVVGSDETTSADTSLEKETYRIGDLASEFNVTLRTLRFYEDRGLLHPKRSGSTRIYSRFDRDRFKTIMMLKSAGFSLIDIEYLLKMYDRDDQDPNSVDLIYKKCAAQMDNLQKQKMEIEDSISHLRSMLQTIEEFSKPRN